MEEKSVHIRVIRTIRVLSQFLLDHFLTISEDSLRVLNNISLVMLYFESNKAIEPETKGAWRKHPVFKNMDSVEIVDWMRGKK